ncbi:MAG: hypothetical protein HQL01_05600 [Nitrospirae bacterium]|nr:hypothetical protein [Nitrospirota bacterium]
MRKAIILILALFTITSCGKKEVKVQPGESVKAKSAIEKLEKLREYYVRKDADALRSVITPEGFKAIASSMKNFDSVELNFSPRWVDIKDDTIIVLAAWDGTWKLSGQSITEKGSAMFLFTGTPLKLDAILRDSPFVYP